MEISEFSLSGDQKTSTDILEQWVKRLSVLSGLVVILLPTLGYLRIGKRARDVQVGKKSRVVSRPGVLGLMILYVIGGFSLWRPMPLRLSRKARFVFLTLGALLYFPGVGLYLWGYRTLGRMFNISSSVGADIYEDQELVQDGPFAMIRHPMYLGVFLAAWGALLIHRTWAMLIYAFSSLAVVRRARWEEMALAERFGPLWERYCNQTPGWFPVRFN